MKRISALVIALTCLLGALTVVRSKPLAQVSRPLLPENKTLASPVIPEALPTSQLPAPPTPESPGSSPAVDRDHAIQRLQQAMIDAGWTAPDSASIEARLTLSETERWAKRVWKYWPDRGLRTAIDADSGALVYLSDYDGADESSFFDKGDPFLDLDRSLQLVGGITARQFTAYSGRLALPSEEPRLQRQYWWFNFEEPDSGDSQYRNTIEATLDATTGRLKHYSATNVDIRYRLDLDSEDAEELARAYWTLQLEKWSVPCRPERSDVRLDVRLSSDRSVQAAWIVIFRTSCGHAEPGHYRSVRVKVDGVTGKIESISMGGSQD